MRRHIHWSVILCALFLVCLHGEQARAFELEAWGYDGTPQTVTNLPPGSDFVSIAAGDEHGVALKSDGTVVAWGQSFYGQNVPPATLGTCIAVGAGGDLSLAIEAAGTIVAWGHTYADDVPAGTYTAVDAGEYFSVALATNGSIVAWGSDTYGQITNVPSGTDFVQVVAGDSHAVALRSNGSVVSWGNFNGTNGQPTSGTFTQVSAGHNYCLALAGDGSIVHWGDDPWNNDLDVVPAGTDFVEVSAGYIHAMARRTGGSVVGWGNNDYGQSALQAGTDFQAISGGLYWSLSMFGADEVVYVSAFETGDFTGWSSVVGALP